MIISADLLCPARGMSEQKFVTIAYVVLFILLVFMGLSQYIVSWAYTKEKKIYRHLATLKGIETSQYPVEAELEKSGPVRLDQTSSKADLQDLERRVNDEESITASEPSTSHPLELTITSGDNAAQDLLVIKPYYGGDAESSLDDNWKVLGNKQEEQGIPSEMRQLQTASWLVCIFQMAVLFAMVAVAIFSIYVFLYYVISLCLIFNMF